MQTRKQYGDESPQIQNSPPQYKLFKNALIASFSACVAESFTIPMDTVKVRLQMQNNNMDPIVKQEEKQTTPKADKGESISKQ